MAMWQLQLIIFFTAHTLCSGCFITNCPPGGKRSVPESEKVELRECAACGPEGQGGHCFGPDTCCSPEFGCFFGTHETSACRQEARVSKLCHNDGDPCTGNMESGSLNGVCAAEGICCSTETCEPDDTCRFDLMSKEIPLSQPKKTSSRKQLSQDRLLAPPLPPQAPPPLLEIPNSYKLAFRSRFSKRENSKTRQQLSGV